MGDFLDPEMTVRNKVKFPDVYSTGNDCDESNASGQKVVKVSLTANFDATDGNKGWRVIIGRGTDREEEGTVDSIDANVSITLDANLAYNHTVTQEQTLDQQSAAAQKKVYLTLTANLLAGETVVISAGETEEESGVIASVNADDYITLVDDLANTHAIGRKCKHTAPAGISVVEVLWAGVSEVIVKKHYKRLSLFTDGNWVTAKITFLGSLSKDGTYLEVDTGIAGTEATVENTEANKCVGLDGILRDSLETVPYLKLRSGIVDTEIDQYSDAQINYVLMR